MVSWRIIVVTLASLTLMPKIPAMAQTVDVQADFTGCLTVFGAAERLACYDRIARYAVSQQANESPVKPAAPVEHLNGLGSGLAADRPVLQQSPQQFGSERLPRSAAQAALVLNRVSAKIVNLSTAPSGRFTVELDNGQIWRQIEGDESITRYSKRSTLSVSITRGALNSYDLTFNDQNASFKVVRIR